MPIKPVLIGSITSGDLSSILTQIEAKGGKIVSVSHEARSGGNINEYCVTYNDNDNTIDINSMRPTSSTMKGGKSKRKRGTKKNRK